MKTRKISKSYLHDVAYNFSDVTVETLFGSWNFDVSGYSFKPERSCITFIVDKVLDDFRVLFHGPYGRTWNLLFVSKDLRSVLRELYDFLYV